MIIQQDSIDLHMLLKRFPPVSMLYIYLLGGKKSNNGYALMNKYTNRMSTYLDIQGMFR